MKNLICDTFLKMPFHRANNRCYSTRAHLYPRYHLFNIVSGSIEVTWYEMNAPLSVFYIFSTIFSFSLLVWVSQSVFHSVCVCLFSSIFLSFSLYTSLSLFTFLSLSLPISLLILFYVSLFLLSFCLSPCCTPIIFMSLPLIFCIYFSFV